jgi:hypothetical protein
MRRQVASTVRSAAFFEERLELGEELLDRVEVGAVGRQEEQLGAGLADCLAHGAPFVAAEIVHDDDVAGLQGGNEELLDIGEEASAVDRPVDHAGGIDAVVAQRGQEGHRAPAAVRHFGDEPRAAQRAAVAARHVGLGPGLVDEDQPRRIELALMQLPSGPLPRHVSAILLAGVHAFFEADPRVVEQPPNRSVARRNTALMKLGHQLAQRHVRLRRNAPQQPVTLAQQLARQPASHRLRRHAAG